MSLTTTPIMAFVATAMPDRAREFYGKTLGLRLISEDGFALAFDVNGTILRVTRVQEVRPQPYTVLGWVVSDIAQAVQDLEGRDVTFLRVPGLPQDEHGIWTAPGGAKIAWFKDPDGNTLSLTELT